MVYVYRLKMAVDQNVALEIDASSLDELATEFVNLGGDEDWLRNTARAVVAASLYGESVRTVSRSLGPVTVLPESEIDPFAGDVSSSGTPESAESTTSAPTIPNASPETSSSTVMSDPFAEDSTPLATSASASPSSVMSPEKSSAPADPWADENGSFSEATEADKEWPGEAAVAREALTTNKPPPADPWGTPEPNAPAVPQTPTETTTDNFGRQWTAGHRDAPDCYCDPAKPAAMMTARGRDSGNLYKKWKCAKAISSSTYKSACALDEFVNSR